jgi:hypothetical protein
MDRACASGAQGQRFESSRARHFPTISILQVFQLGIAHFSDEFALLDFLDSRYNPSRFNRSRQVSYCG